ncbi:MAG: hypothetical protein AMXMBFR34_24700 [Myxococcaceae bacterium]
MAFHGDLSSYPLPDLLQWLDASRKTGALGLTWDAGQRKIFLLTGQIVATAAPGLWERLARVMEQGGEAQGERVLAMLKRGQATEPAVTTAVRQVAEEDLLGSFIDLNGAQGGRFHWTEDPDRGEDEWVSMELPLRHVVFEALRRVDEAHEVERVFPHDHLVVRPVTGTVKPSHALGRAVLRLVGKEPEMTLSRVWLALGVSRGVVTRAVYDLLRTGRVSVDGARTPDSDPIAEMLEKGAVLLRERQFDAAALVFATLMQRDPGDRRVREFARMVEREHVAALYREIAPVTVFDVAAEPQAMTALRPDERNLVGQLQSGWDLSAVVLASPQRELDTLKAIHKLVRQGIVTPRSESSGAPE